MTAPVHVFVYDPEGPGAVLGAQEKVREAAVPGTLFDVEGVGPALMLAGTGAVRGAVWRTGAEQLALLDARARVGEGLFRRVGVRVGDTPCWTWVAGPALAQRLARARRGRAAGEDA